MVGAVSDSLRVQSAMGFLIEKTLNKAAELSQEQALALAEQNLQAQIDAQKLASVEAAANVSGVGEILDVLA